MKSEPAVRSITRTGGRPATQGLIEGQFALSVGMPNTRPPEGWRWTPLSDVARLESGHTPSRKKPEYWGGDIPWIGIRDATGNHGRVLFDTEQHTNQLGIANSSARLLPAHTVCLSRTASVGYVVAMGRPMATSQDFVNWVCGEHIDWRFLKYVLLAEHESYSRFAHGTTHQTIYFPEVKAFHVCLPPIGEQRRIAGLLGALDDKIELERRRRQRLDQVARLQARRLFRECPQSCFEAISDHFDVVRGLSYTGSGLVESAADGLPMHNLNSVREGGGYKFEGIKFFAGKHAERHLLAAGDLIVANTEQGFDELLIGFPAIVPATYGRAGLFSHHLYRFTPKPGSPLTQRWLFYWLLQPAVHDEVAGYANGTTVNMLPPDALAVPTVPVPTQEVVSALDAVALAVLAEVERSHGEERRLAAVRDALLPKLVSGEIRVAEDYEPDNPLDVA